MPKTNRNSDQIMQACQFQDYKNQVQKDMIKQYEAINTFSRKPVPAQIATYLIFIGQTITFFICMYINYRSTAKQIAILIIYLVTCICQILITLKTSCIDPSDDIMIQYRNGNNRKNMNIEECLYCDICVSYVKESSRHCKVCQRCVQQFDHHCMWINNCVGSKNYKDFLAMIILTLINMLTYIVGMILLWTQTQWSQYFGSMVTIWVFSVVVVIFCLLLFNLVGLHIYLIYKGLTTYQFIMLQRDEQRKKKEQQQHASSIQMAVNPNRQNTIAGVRQRSNGEVQQRNQDEQRPPGINHGEFKNQSNMRSHENSDVIFGAHLNENQNKTSKSERMSEQNINNQSNMRKQIRRGEQSNQHDDDQPSPLNSKADENQSNLSHFFTKNKSLKFFIGDQIGSRPKSSRNPNVNNKAGLYNSLRVVNKETGQKSVMHSSVVGNPHQMKASDKNQATSVKFISLQQDNRTNIETKK